MGALVNRNCWLYQLQLIEHKQKMLLKTFILIVIFTTAARTFPQQQNRCGLNQFGMTRQPGDTWDEECNKCKCLDTGVPGCTRKFCGAGVSIPAINPRGCKDSLGGTRLEGASWDQDGRVCTCRTGSVQCQPLLAVPEIKNQGGSSSSGGINFPGANLAAKVCKDNQGNTRTQGESWNDGCNNCVCTKSGQSACTEKLCLSNGVNSKQDSKAVLFKEDLTRDVSGKVQCKQTGVQNCRAVILNLEALRGLKQGDTVGFTSIHSFPMVLKRAPTTGSHSLSYVFSLDTWGEAIITVSSNKNSDNTAPSVYGSVKPLSGSVNYFLESCGANCNVLYERSVDFFNQFED